jgi:Flp pilus assembly pilin Flp
MYKRWARELWSDESGAMAFEWVLLTTLVVLGVIGGLAAARDAVIDELGDAAQAMLALDNSFSIEWPLEVLIDLDTTSGPGPEAVGLGTDSSFLDALAYTDCTRATLPIGQPAQADSDS